MTFADLVFVPWNERLEVVLMVDIDRKFDGFPNLKAWHELMVSRPSWKRTMDVRAKLMDEQGLMWNGMPKGIASMEEYIAKMEKDAEPANMEPVSD